MAWNLEGTYFENCNCDAVCPCTWSGMTAPATHDRCNAMLAFSIDRGEVEGVDVSGLHFAMVLDTPKQMTDGGWRVAAVVDAAASPEQAEAIGRVLGGDLGGPPAMLGPLIGEMLGVEQAPVEWRDSGGTFAVRFGDLIDVEVRDFVAGDAPGPVQMLNIFHPASSTLTVSPATRSTVDVLGISFGETGTSGFNAPFAWSA